MLRLAALSVLLLALSVSAADDDEPAVPPLYLYLLCEDMSMCDSDTLSEVEEIDAAKKRFYDYRDNLCKTDDDIKATRDCFKRVLDRIIQRARKKVREAEENRERIIERSRGEAVPT